MTQRKVSDRSEPAAKPKRGQPGEDEATDFDKPDAETAAQGAPAHEHEGSTSGAQEPSDVRANDEKHGYSQDSGYSSSGGRAAAGSDRVSREAPRPEHGGSEGQDGNGTRSGNGHGDGFGTSDEQIRKELQQRLTREGGTRGSRLLISIGDGIVTLKGEVTSPAEQRRLVDIVRSVPSVREVRQELHVRSNAPPN